MLFDPILMIDDLLARLENQNQEGVNLFGISKFSGANLCSKWFLFNPIRNINQSISHAKINNKSKQVSHLKLSMQKKIFFDRIMQSFCSYLSPLLSIYVWIRIIFKFIIEFMIESMTILGIFNSEFMNLIINLQQTHETFQHNKMITGSNMNKYIVF